MPLLEVKGVTKRFPNVVADDDVSLHVDQGEILGIVGENGAGKTTLMRIICGLERPDSGEIYWKGKRIIISSPKIAMKLGIAMVHQHFQLFPSLTVLENVVLGVEPTVAGVIFHRALARKAVGQLVMKFEFQLDLSARVGSLSIGEQQRVELLKALYRQAQLLILDEPTTVLTPQEVQKLFTLLKQLRNEGISIILISHKLKEILSICSRIIVMRKGKVVASIAPENADEKELAKLMVGGELTEVEKGKESAIIPTASSPLLVVENLSTESQPGRVGVKNVSLKVYPGEIVGVGGIEGNGQQELVEALLGLRRVVAGHVWLKGQEVTGATPARIRQLGLAVIPGDRMREGANLSATLTENVVAVHYRRRPFAAFGLINYRLANKFTQTLVDEYGIQARPLMLARQLSGGNLQRMIIARELSTAPEMLIAVHPTRGLDVRSTLEVRKRLLELRRNGVGILLITADMDELLLLPDRILVLYRGRFIAEVIPSQTTPEELGLLMLGGLHEATSTA